MKSSGQQGIVMDVVVGIAGAFIGGEFTLPGLPKIVAQNVPAKKRRFGKDPFTGNAGLIRSRPPRESRPAP